MLSRMIMIDLNVIMNKIHNGYTRYIEFLIKHQQVHLNKALKYIRFDLVIIIYFKKTRKYLYNALLKIFYT